MSQPAAFVIPWYGKELKGGAEQLAWQVTQRLAQRGHPIEVLTTCCQSFLDNWSQNQLPAGVSRAGEVTVRRFKVDRQDQAAFNRVNQHLLNTSRKRLIACAHPFAFETDQVFASENIQSKKLLKYLRKHGGRYRAIAFLPYLYGPILHGLPLVAEKAFLVPCLHDEAYAYLQSVETLFRRAHGIIYNSAGEQMLAQQMFGPGIAGKGQVVGLGVETTVAADSSQDDEDGDFILCLGRRDATKNVDFLIDAYRIYRKIRTDTRLRLIVAGPGEKSYDDADNGIVDLGLVSEDEKERLLAQCRALFQPSTNESYSRVVMEAWLYQKPVVVHADCLATATAVAEAKGGWTAGDTAQWVERFTAVEDASAKELKAYGRKGEAYAFRYAVWDRVIDRYEKILFAPQPSANSVSCNGITHVHQIVTGFTHGDAISNQAVAIRDHLIAGGYGSVIYAKHLDSNMNHQARPFAEGCLNPADALIYHHSIGAGMTDAIMTHPGPKGLIYHNVTPPEMVDEQDPELAAQLRQGRAELAHLAPAFSVSMGDSKFNAAELVQNGYAQPGVLPIIVDPIKWNFTPEIRLVRELSDGRTNILFVGRIVANKCHRDLVDAFYSYLSMDPDARLFIVGGYDRDERCYIELMSRIESLGMEHHVQVTGKVSDRALCAYYHCADLYWSMSEHEGFGVPLIEAMWFNVPVMAYKSSAVPETLGPGGILFDDKKDLAMVSVLAHMMVSDPGLREKVLLAQRRRRCDFLPAAVVPVLENMIQEMGKNID